MINFKKKGKLNFFMDVSGTPPAKTCFSLVSFNAFTMDDILDEFFNKYPKYLDKKGRNLNIQDFIDIVKFFNNKKVRMTVFSRTNLDWSYYNNIYKTYHEYKEKICGIIYFHMVTRFARPNNRYDITSCVESQFGDIHRAFHHFERLHNITKSNPRYNYEFSFNHSTDRHNRGVKIADFIAYSARCLKDAHLKKFNIKRYYILKDRPDKWYFRVIFK